MAGPASRILFLAALSAAVLSAMPATAWSDADPASDVLPLQDVFLPYRGVSPATGKRLSALVAAAKKSGYQIKVAVIATEDDLGGVVQLFNKPDKYAAFLGNEIAYNVKRKLLIVMPKGLGLRDGSAAENQALDRLKAPPGTKPNAEGLTEIAFQAVDALATTSGHSITDAQIAAAAKTLPNNPASPHAAFASSGSKSSKGGGVPIFVIFGLPVVLVALGAVIAMRRGRHDPADA